MRKLATLAFASLWALGIPAAAWSKVPPAKDLVTLRLEGAMAFTPEEVFRAAGIEHSPTSRLLRKAPKTERSDLDAKAEAVRLFYQRNGYFEISTELVSEEGGSGAVIRLVEGQPCLVLSVDLGFAEGAPPGESDFGALGADLPMKSGVVFSADAYEASTDVIRDRLREDGRPFAAVVPEAVVDLQAHSVAIRFTLQPGQRCTVGNIEFRGRKLSEERVLRRALTFAPGDLYRQSAVEESQSNFYKLGLFESVAFVARPGAVPGTVDMRVRMKEGKLHRLRGGIGYGTEDHLRAQIRWETLRFAKHTLLVGAEVKASSIDNRLEAYLRRPYVWDSRTTFLSNLSLGNRSELDFDYKYLKAQAGFQREFSTRAQGSTAVVLERILQFTPNQSLENAIAGGAREVATMASLAGNFTYKTSDAPLDPTKGFLANFYAEPTRVLEDGTFFTKAIVEGRQYFGLREGWVFGLRLKVGAILAADPNVVPLTRRFYAGGPNSVRGYGYNSLGPSSKDGALVGGYGLVEASAELRFPLKGSLKGVAFLDAGNALPRAFKLPNDWLRAGTGVGVRYQTPVGPLGLDIAWRLKPDARNPSPYQVYFFIGYAF